MKNENNFYMRIALVVSEQSHCLRSKVGAVLVHGTNILSFGYNGTPSGFDNCCEYGVRRIIPTEELPNGIELNFNMKDLCKKFDLPEDLIEYEIETKQEVIHAEANAILKCAKEGRSTESATLFVTMCPCVECAKMIIQAGIVEVFYMEEYRDKSGVDLLIKAGLAVTRISI